MPHSMDLESGEDSMISLYNAAAVNNQPATSNPIVIQKLVPTKEPPVVAKFIEENKVEVLISNSSEVDKSDLVEFRPVTVMNTSQRELLSQNNKLA